MAGTGVDADRVISGVANAAGVYLAPVGTTAPTSADGALDAAFYTVGYLTDSGPEPSFEPSFTDVPAWQSVFPIKKIPEASTLTLAFTMSEVAPQSAALYFGVSVPTETTGAFSISIPSTPTQQVYSVVMQVKDDTSYVRLYIARAALSASGTMQVIRNGAIQMPVTLETLDNGAAAVGAFFSKQAV